jgi:single-stranded DNA-specific DHH superfamily exonuclease
LAQLDPFLRRLARAKETIVQSGLKDAVILHHDEADGLCSAALTKIAIEKLGIETRLICLDKLYPEVVKDVEGGSRSLVVFSDLGSGHVQLLESQNRSMSILIVLDHHDTSESKDPLVHNLNPELNGFSGEKDASSSTVAYLFAKTVDPTLGTFAPLAIIGSTEIPGEAQGLNKIPIQDGEKTGAVKRTPRGGIKFDGAVPWLSPSRASSILNVLGSVGYYRSGPQLGLSACINGFEKQTLEIVRVLEEERKKANQRMMEKIRNEGLSQMKNIQWFHARENYKGMSGKVVGSFCSYLSYQRFVNPVKYLIGMMNVPPDIPGWGRLPSPLVKVSGRAPQPLGKMIEGGKRPPLSRILPDSCEKVGGFGDGHTVAASGVFPIGREEAFLEALDALARTAPFSSGTDSQTPNGNSQTNQDSSPETIAIRSPKFG